MTDEDISSAGAGPEFPTNFERNSDVKGFTIVVRNGRSPKVHLMVPWPECNATEAKSGKDTVRFEGGREQLVMKLGELGYRRGIPCRRCFRYSEEKDVEKPVLEMGDTTVVETLDKYDGEQARVDLDVPVEL